MKIKKTFVPNLGTVQKIKRLYEVKAPDGTPALTIEGLELNDLNYPIMVQKGLYRAGDYVLYVKWDTNLPITNIFKDFISPDGNPKKSMLAPDERVRVIKLAGNYSNGIILPLKEVEEFLKIKIPHVAGTDLTKELELYKTEKINDNFLIAGNMPSFLYKTNEHNIFDVNDDNIPIKDVINDLYKKGSELQITVKKDGRSKTIYSHLDLMKKGICSRSAELKRIYNLDDIPFDLKVQMIEHKLAQSKLGSKIMKDITKKEYDAFMLDEEIWIKRGDDNRQKTAKNYELYQGIISGNAEKFKKQIENFKLKLKLEPQILAEKENGYFEPFVEFCNKNGKSYALRGEVTGYAPGSGNKKNPDKKNKKVVWFGLDEINPVGIRVPTNAKINLYSVCKELGFEATPIIKRGVFSFDELIAFGNEFFKNNLVEGLIIRTTNDNQLSCKLMNSVYDAK